MDGESAGAFRILVVDDDPAQRRTLTGFLRRLGYRALEAADGEEALQVAQEASPHLVISDVRMPGIDGITLLKRLRTLRPETAVLLITAFASYAQSVEAVKAGAWDYIPKPIDLDELRVKVWKIQQELAGGGAQPVVEEGLIAASPAMQRVMELLRRAAATDATVLLLGESGTGKSRLAEWVHRHSSRRTGPFVVVSCAALPESLIEAELFGYEKGAFTGAERSRPGRFELAHGGTLFLDEIGEVPLATQVKLLRVLQDRVIERLGASGEPRPVDVRIVAATNRDLETAVAEGSFREDLYYRLNVVSVEVPPLRERREDIPLLIDLFLRRYTPPDRPLPDLSEEARALLLSYDYPGNVRELENAIERAVILSQGNLIRPLDLPPAIAQPRRRTRAAPSGDTLPDAVESLEREMILQALLEAGGVQTRAAEKLGITERNLRYKMKKYGIPPLRSDSTDSSILSSTKSSN
ncbi:MAG: acetoacetate metabolism regulatory protein AtoC [Candidatus Poribacteria bacterium]|nr:MAG: acetoacetate metabolism regulatory protein AtoC [Candidatus Poribacteria bacterium]